MILAPSTFNIRPVQSIFSSGKAELVAWNIMAILSRTGDAFRELTFEEYEKERLKDSIRLDSWEKEWFERVLPHTVSAEVAGAFCVSWTEEVGKVLTLLEESTMKLLAQQDIEQIRAAVEKEFDSTDHSKYTINTSPVSWHRVFAYGVYDVCLRRALYFNRPPKYEYRLKIGTHSSCGGSDYEDIQSALTAGIVRVLKETERGERGVKRVREQMRIIKSKN